MRIVVFGASRGVGARVVEQALEDGHTVTAFVRSPASLSLQHPNLRVVGGDAMDPEAVDQAVAGQEAVVNAIGPTRPPVEGMMETSARNIVAAMHKHGVRRLVMTTGAGIRQPEDRPKLIDRFFYFLLGLLAREVVLDSAASVRVVQDSDLDWTIVRFPRLVDGERTGGYRAGYVSRDSSIQLSRADGADFLLRELLDKNWVRKLPAVSY